MYVGTRATHRDRLLAVRVFGGETQFGLRLRTGHAKKCPAFRTLGLSVVVRNFLNRGSSQGLAIGEEDRGLLL